MIKQDLPQLHELLHQMNLPDVLTFDNGMQVCHADEWSMRRSAILDNLRREIYGYSPEPPASVAGQVINCLEHDLANKAVQWSLVLNFETPKGSFAFPLTLIIPKRVQKPPTFLNIAFRPDIPDKYLPVEEIIDNGYAIASFCYLDVSADAADDFRQGLPAHYPRDPETGWGKISVWAWAASRVMDYLQTRDDLDHGRIAVVGHSRLGKTALWCGAQDERFSLVISNNSGCAGAALHRGKSGERVEQITRMFPFWFCGRFPTYANREEALPFDQHHLLALAAPRALYISSAAEDDWADPRSEFLSALAASPVYEILGQDGLLTPDRLPTTGTDLHQGRIAYHLREGSHFLSRSDWQKFMTFRRDHQDRF